MEKFEILLNELLREPVGEPGGKTCRSEGPGVEQREKPGEQREKPGEQRELVIRYATGRERDAKVYEGTRGKTGPQEDAYAILYAVGNLLGKELGLDGKALGDGLVRHSLKMMIKKSLEGLFDE